MMMFTTWMSMLCHLAGIPWTQRDQWRKAWSRRISQVSAHLDEETVSDSHDGLIAVGMMVKLRGPEGVEMRRGLLGRTLCVCQWRLPWLLALC
jgi:hypothetical protein